MDKLKAIFHVNETANWQKTLTNISNFIKDAGAGNVDVEVLANGAAVDIFKNNCQVNDGGCGCVPSGRGKKQDTLPKMHDLAQMGIKIAACRNALKAHAIDESKLPSFVTVVPAGITEIVKKQSAGYAYIKP